MRRRARRLVLAILVALVVVPFSQQGRSRRRRVLVLRLRRRSRHRDVAVGRLRARPDGLEPRADPEALLSRNGGGGLLLGTPFDPRRADVGPHDRAPEGAGRARPPLARLGQRRARRQDPGRGDMERRGKESRVGGPGGQRAPGRRPSVGRATPGPDRHLRGHRRPGLHPRGGCDLVPGVLLRPRHDRDEPHILRRRERMRGATDRTPPVRGLPPRARRGTGVVADGGDARPGGRGAHLRGLRREALRPAGRLQLRYHRRRGGPDLYRLEPRGRKRRRSLGASGHVHGRGGRHLRRSVDPGFLRGIRRRALRQRRGRVARREPRLQDPVADRGVRSGRVHRREPLDRLDQELHRGRGHLAARAVHRLDRHAPALHLDPAGRGWPHHQRGRRRRRRLGDGHGHRDEVRPRLVRRARVDQQRSHDPWLDPGDLRPARLPAGAAGIAAAGGHRRSAAVLRVRRCLREPQLGTDRVAEGTDRSGVPCRGRGRGRVGRADDRAVGAHGPVEHLRRLQADHVRRRPDLLRARRPVPTRSGARCSTRI